MEEKRPEFRDWTDLVATDELKLIPEADRPDVTKAPTPKHLYRMALALTQNQVAGSPDGSAWEAIMKRRKNQDRPLSPKHSMNDALKRASTLKAPDEQCILVGSAKNQNVQSRIVAISVVSSTQAQTYCFDVDDIQERIRSAPDKFRVPNPAYDIERASDLDRFFSEDVVQFFEDYDKIEAEAQTLQRETNTASDANLARDFIVPYALREEEESNPSWLAWAVRGTAKNLVKWTSWVVDKIMKHPLFTSIAVACASILRILLCFMITNKSPTGAAIDLIRKQLVAKVGSAQSYVVMVFDGLMAVVNCGLGAMTLSMNACYEGIAKLKKDLPLFTLVRTFGRVLLTIVGGKRPVEFLRTYFPGAVTEYVVPMLELLRPQVRPLSRGLKVEVPVSFEVETTTQVPFLGGLLSSAHTTRTRYEETWLYNDLQAIDKQSVFSESIVIKTFVTVAIVLGALAVAGVLLGAMMEFIKRFVGKDENATAVAATVRKDMNPAFWLFTFLNRCFVRFAGASLAWTIFQELVAWVRDLVPCALDTWLGRGTCDCTELQIFGLDQIGFQAVQAAGSKVAEWFTKARAVNIWPCDARLKVILRKDVGESFGVPLHLYAWSDSRKARTLWRSVGQRLPDRNARFVACSARDLAKRFPEAVTQIGPQRMLVIDADELPARFVRHVRRLNDDLLTNSFSSGKQVE